jgi:hypothetical protein
VGSGVGELDSVWADLQVEIDRLTHHRKVLVVDSQGKAGRSGCSRLCPRGVDSRNSYNGNQQERDQWDCNQPFSHVFSPSA